MVIDGIYSLRDFCNENFRDCVFEWEDDIHDFLGHKNDIKCISNPHDNLFAKLRNKILHRLPFKNNSFDKLKIAFCMSIFEIDYFKLVCVGGVLPIFIDFWPRDIKAFIKIIGMNYAVVTSLDMYYLVSPYCPNVIYMPLCISNRWIDDVPQKENIIVQMGRNNPVLQNYAMQYSMSHSDIEYIYAKYNQMKKHLTYYSTKKGIIDTPETRQEYMQVLKRAKICLLSSPGIDNTRPMARGIDYPTPRFYETAVNYCHMIGRYNETHQEFIRQGIDRVCHNIKSYAQFEFLCDEIINGNRAIDKRIYDAFIERHTTRTWIGELLDKVNALPHVLRSPS